MAEDGKPPSKRLRTVLAQNSTTELFKETTNRYEDKRTKIDLFTWACCFIQFRSVISFAPFSLTSNRDHEDDVQFLKTQWLFVQHPYADFYLLFIQESEIFKQFRFKTPVLPIQNVICLFRCTGRFL